MADDEVLSKEDEAELLEAFSKRPFSKGGMGLVDRIDAHGASTDDWDWPPDDPRWDVKREED